MTTEPKIGPLEHPPVPENCNFFRYGRKGEWLFKYKSLNGSAATPIRVLLRNDPEYWKPIISALAIRAWVQQARYHRIHPKRDHVVNGVWYTPGTKGYEELTAESTAYQNAVAWDKWAGGLTGFWPSVS